MILVLGGRGFIGKNVCRKLVEGGEEVFSLDKEKEGHAVGVNVVVADFFSDEVFKFIDRADIIIHSISTVSTSNADCLYLRGYEKDLIQTIKIFEYVSLKKKRLIFLSSGGTVYGDSAIIPIKEEACQTPINHYGVIKLCMEKSASVFNRKYGNNIICLRISNPYGPGQDFTKGIGFIDAVLKKSLNNETLTIWGDGNIIRDFIYIDDVADIIKFFCYYNGKETVINVGTGVGKSQKQIIEIIKKMGLGINVHYDAARTVDVKMNVLDCTRLKSIYPNDIKELEEGIKEYYEYIK